MNQGEQKNNIENRNAAVGSLSVEDLVVHTMPKRYVKFQTSQKSAKWVGIAILIIGIIFLIALSVFLYLYLIKPEEITPQSSIQEKKENTTEQQNNNTKIIEENLVISKDNENIQENNNQTIEENNKEEIDDNKTVINFNEATSTKNISSATDVVATSTAKSNQNKINESEFKFGIDSDNDGLTDQEEALLGSSLNMPDSDYDGYGDLSEMLNLYNPAGPDRLVDNKNINKYQNISHGYHVLYPSFWIISKIDGDDSVLFKLDESQFIQIIVQSNEDNETIENWYRRQFGVDAMDSNMYIGKDKWHGILSEDKLTLYIQKDNSKNILTISYNLGLSNLINYKNIFDMMVISLDFEEL